MRPLTLMQTLEYYDVPQIFVATDAMGTRYLCTLFDRVESDGYKYIGVQISEPRLMAFLGGQLDLRHAYLYPEAENAVYLVMAQKETLNATALLQQQDITENMLPEAGYFYDTSDLVKEETPSLDSYQLDVPVRDRITFSTLVSRMGWRASSLRKAVSMTGERQKHIIEAITEKAKSVVPPHSEMILFGSRARGDAHEDSDWDILILLDKDSIRFEDYALYSYPFRELGWDLGQYINVVLFTKKGWQEDAASPFHENVTEEGIKIWT